MVSHMATHGIGRDGSKIVKSEVKTESGLNSDGFQTLTGLWNSRKVFPVEEFKAVLSAPTTDIEKDESDLDIAQNSSQNI